MPIILFFHSQTFNPIFFQISRLFPIFDLLFLYNTAIIEYAVANKLIHDQVTQINKQCEMQFENVYAVTVLLLLYCNINEASM